MKQEIDTSRLMDSHPCDQPRAAGSSAPACSACFGRGYTYGPTNAYPSTEAQEEPETRECSTCHGTGVKPNSPICVKTGSGDSANAPVTGGVPAVPANGLFSISRFRSVLVKHGIVFPEAIEDAEGFDGERTLAATRAAYEELMENESIKRGE